MAGRPSSVREQHWRELIAAQRSSGLSVSAFCREREVSAASFFRWRRILDRGREDVAGKFVPIEMAPPPSLGGPVCFEVALRNGLRVFVPPRFDTDSLRELLDVLKDQAC